MVRYRQVVHLDTGGELLDSLLAGCTSCCVPPRVRVNPPSDVACSPRLSVTLCCFTSQFSLIAGLIRYLFSKTEINVLILGLDYAGKTVSV